jgi:hypothetical protein
MVREIKGIYLCTGTRGIPLSRAEADGGGSTVVEGGHDNQLNSASLATCISLMRAVC